MIKSNVLVVILLSIIILPIIVILIARIFRDLRRLDGMSSGGRATKAWLIVGFVFLVNLIGMLIILTKR